MIMEIFRVGRHKNEPKQNQVMIIWMLRHHSVNKRFLNPHKPAECVSSVRWYPFLNRNLQNHKYFQELF